MSKEMELTSTPNPSNDSAKTNDMNVELAFEHNRNQELTILSGKCGIGPCTPSFMQRFASIKVFAFFFTIIGLMSSSLGSYFVTQLVTIEKQFGLPSAKSSLLISSREIGNLVSVMIFTHLGRYLHKPRMIASLCMLFIPALILMILPHILLMQHKDDVFVDVTTIDDDFYQPAESLSQYYSICVNETHGSDEKIPIVVQLRDTAFGLMVTAVIVEGIAKGPRFSLAMSYIDDNLDKTKTGFYFGIIMCLSTFGPALSYGIGGIINGLYVTLNETPLEQNDPRWIGAWWFGYMVLCLPTIFFATVMFFFPKNIHKEISYEEKEHEEKPFSAFSAVKEFPKSVLRLLTNPIFMIVSMAGCIHSFSIASIITYFPKFCEQYFHATPVKASIMLGSFMMSGAALGVFVGGLITRLMKLNLKGCLLLIFIASFLDGLLCFSFRLLHCDPVNPVGHVGINLMESDMDLYANVTQCNSACGCSDQYFPICGSDSTTYYSPCHAGCQLDAGNLFSNCSCVASLFENGTAIPGYCEDECDMFPFFIGISSIGALISTLTVIPTTIATIRAVSAEDKTFALGVAQVLSVVLGSLFSPIVMGNLIDTTCKIWQYTKEIRGSCQLYISDDLNRVYTLTIASSFLLEATSVLISLIILMVWRRHLLEANHNLHGKEKNDKTSNGYSKDASIKAETTEHTRF